MPDIITIYPDFPVLPPNIKPFLQYIPPVSQVIVWEHTDSLSDPGCAEQQRNDDAGVCNHQVSPTVTPPAVGLSGWLTFSPKSGRKI